MHWRCTPAALMQKRQPQRHSRCHEHASMFQGMHATERSLCDCAQRGPPRSRQVDCVNATRVLMRNSSSLMDGFACQDWRGLATAFICIRLLAGVISHCCRTCMLCASSVTSLCAPDSARNCSSAPFRTVAVHTAWRHRQIWLSLHAGRRATAMHSPR